MFTGAYEDFNWEISEGMVRVESKNPRIGFLKAFGPVNPMTTEQAQWAAQGRIDLNRAELEQLEAEMADRL